MKTNSLFLLQIVVYVITLDGAEKCNDRCCFNFFEDQNGTCVECPLGSYGLNCSRTCLARYYGYLCLNKCECPAHQCDQKYGCEQYRSDISKGESEKDISIENENKWRRVKFGLIGSGSTLLLIGLLISLKSGLAKRERLLIDTAQMPLENNQEGAVGVAHGYESRIGLHPTEDIVDNYTYLRSSRLSERHPDLGSSPSGEAYNSPPEKFAYDNILDTGDEELNKETDDVIYEDINVREDEDILTNCPKSQTQLQW